MLVKLAPETVKPDQGETEIPNQLKSSAPTQLPQLSAALPNFQSNCTTSQIRQMTENTDKSQKLPQWRFCVAAMMDGLWSAESLNPQSSTATNHCRLLAPAHRRERYRETLSVGSARHDYQF
jgi:hypothetical protein